MVMMRSWEGIRPESALSRVVLPLPVPPLTMTLKRARTKAASSMSVCSSREPRPMSSGSVYARGSGGW